MSSFRRFRTLALVLLAAAAACDGPSDPSVGLEPGTFEIEVSGDTTFALRGHAGYRSPQMLLTTQSTPQQVDFFQFFVGVPDDPQERRYDAMEQGGGTVYIVRQGTIQRRFAVDGGTLEIDEVTAETVAGTVEVMADEVDVEGDPIPGSTITVRATFKAARAIF